MRFRISLGPSSVHVIGVVGKCPECPAFQDCGGEVAECSCYFCLPLLGLVGQAVIGVALLPPTHLFVVADLGAGVTLGFEGFAFLLSDLTGGSRTMTSLATPATLFMAGGFRTGSDPQPLISFTSFVV